MNKFTLLSGIAVVTGLLAFLPKASAQITIDQADLPSAGLKVVVDSDGTALPSAGIASITTAQNWDFSGLLRQKSKTDTFMLASASPYASVFTTANLCDSTYGGNGYNFFNTSPTNLSVVGAEEIEAFDGYNFQIEINLNPPFVQSALPVTTTTNNITGGDASGSQTFAVTFSVIVTGEEFVTNIIYNDTVDAYGTMEMPNGNSYPVLRQRHSELDVDSIFLDIAGTWTYYEKLLENKNQYDWYAKGVGFILAEMDMSTTWDTAVDVWWDTTAPAPVVSNSINEISNRSKINVYPNPANSQVTFMAVNKIEMEQYITIFDITGRNMSQVEIKNGMAMLNTDTYSNGIYLYKLTDSSGTLLNQGKFVIQH